MQFWRAVTLPGWHTSEEPEVFSCKQRQLALCALHTLSLWQGACLPHPSSWEILGPAMEPVPQTLFSTVTLHMDFCCCFYSYMVF